jgi:hypothetical protein
MARGARALALALVLAAAAEAQRDRVLLEQVQALTFARGRLTSGRRSSPVQQLSCVAGDCASAAEPEVVQCRNVGLDDTGEVQWRCEARLPSNYELGTTDVSCEGYDSRTDRFVLAGSCGLEYTLRRTGPSAPAWGGAGAGAQPRHHDGYEQGGRSSSWLGSAVSWLFFGVFVLLVIHFVSLFLGGSPAGPQHHARRSPGAAGAGAYSFDDHGHTRSDSGFWQGLGLGGLFGYGLGSSGTRPYGSYWDNGSGGGWGGGWGGWGGWGGGYGGRSAYSSGYAAGSSAGLAQGASAASVAQPPREHTSTGYGTTRRR